MYEARARKARIVRVNTMRVNYLMNIFKFMRWKEEGLGIYTRISGE